MRSTSKIPIRIFTVTKGEAVNVAVTLILGRAIIQETTNASTLDFKINITVHALEDLEATYTATMGVHDENKAIKLPNSVYAGRANARPSIVSIPKLEVSTSSSRPAGSEFKIQIPFSFGNAGQMLKKKHKGAFSFTS